MIARYVEEGRLSTIGAWAGRCGWQIRWAKVAAIRDDRILAFYRNDRILAESVVECVMLDAAIARFLGRERIIAMMLTAASIPSWRHRELGRAIAMR